MKKNHGFTRLEMFVLLVVCVLAIGIVFPMLTTTTRGPARQMHGSTHARGIQSGLILYAQGNKDFYPGFKDDGTVANATLLPTKPGEYGTNSTSGHDVNYRLAVLLRGNYFSPEYMISPSEKEQKAVIKPNENLTAAHYSYAMLRIGDANAKGRRDEWKATNNSRAAVLSDRNLGPGAADKALSIHTSHGEGWRGAVVYNDNHAVFETTNHITTEFGVHEKSNEIKLDDLFADDADPSGKHGNDAAMVYQNDHTYVNQK